MIRLVTDEESDAQTHYYFTEAVPREKIDCIEIGAVVDWMLAHGWSKWPPYHLADIYGYGDEIMSPKIYVFYDANSTARRLAVPHSLQILMDVHHMSLRDLLEQINA